MTDEIIKVLEMNKKGLLSDVQAALLIEELTSKSKELVPSSTEVESQLPMNQQANFSFSKDQSLLTEVKRENHLSFSNVDTPQGYKLNFHSNFFHTTVVRRLRLSAASFKHNKFEGSRCKDLHLFHSIFEENRISKSSIQDSHWNQVQFTSCRFDHCSLNQINAKASLLKKLQLRDCRFNQVSFENCQMDGVVLRNVNLKKLEIRNLKISNVTIDGTENFIDLIEQEE